MTIHRLPIFAALVSLLLLAFSGGALARQDDAAGFSSGGQVGLRINRIGLEGRARPGDWAPIQIEVLHRFSSPKPTSVIVRLDMLNDDGDHSLYERQVTTNPNTPVSVWLYVRIPFGSDASMPFSVSAFLPFDQEAGAESLGAYDSTKPIGRVTAAASGMIDSKSGLIGIVGRRPVGLDRYTSQSFATFTAPADYPVTGHELTQLAEGLLPDNLPDRVHGFRALEALVWAGANADEQPGKLKVAQADAIRKWVAGGGHMIVVLPIVGQTWIDTPNPLSDILPLVHARRLEGVSLEPLRYLLAADAHAPLPTAATIYTFTPDPAAGPFDAMPIIRAPDGGIVIVRRLVGIGAVTLIGIDLPSLAGANGSLRTDAFWNRVLGKRIDLPPKNDLQALIDRYRMNPTLTRRNSSFFERSLRDAIVRGAPAAAGLLVAVVVFGAFWLVAGPVGFFVLKQRAKTQHSWLAYVAAIALFTGISWGAATLMRQRTPDATHITMLDHVYGQPCQRARAWANVLLPSYGTEKVSAAVKPFDLAGRPLTPDNAVAAWEAPTDRTGSEFPESRTYVVDARDPSSVNFPARSTTRAVQFDWLGAPQWDMPLPQAADGAAVPLGQELKLLLPEPGPGLAHKWTVTGTLTHNLPGPLHDVVIIVNRGLNTISRVDARQLICDAGIFTLTKPWDPKTPLDLAQVTDRADATTAARTFLDGITPRLGSTGYQNPTAPPPGLANRSEVVSDLTRLSLYNMLAPPDLLDTGDPRAVARRETTQTLDLGRWFTQPCVIIIGFVDGDCPVPIEVNGRAIPTHGMTAVRWVYPLPASTPDYSQIQSSADSQGPAPSEPDTK